MWLADDGDLVARLTAAVNGLRLPEEDAVAIEGHSGDIDTIPDQPTDSRSHATPTATKWRKRLFSRRPRRDITVKRSAAYILPAVPPLS